MVGAGIQVGTDIIVIILRDNLTLSLQKKQLRLLAPSGPSTGLWPENSEQNDKLTVGP